jgi:hypothetical protein
VELGRWRWGWASGEGEGGGGSEGAGGGGGAAWIRGGVAGLRCGAAVQAGGAGLGDGTQASLIRGGRLVDEPRLLHEPRSTGVGSGQERGAAKIAMASENESGEGSSPSSNAGAMT